MFCGILGSAPNDGLQWIRSKRLELGNVSFVDDDGVSLNESRAIFCPSTLGNPRKQTVALHGVIGNLFPKSNPVIENNEFVEWEWIRSVCRRLGVLGHVEPCRTAKVILARELGKKRVMKFAGIRKVVWNAPRYCRKRVEECSPRNDGGQFVQSFV